jgi:hypothetical protein
MLEIFAAERATVSAKYQVKMTVSELDRPDVHHKACAG